MLCKSVPPLPGSKRVQNEPIYIKDFNTKIATIKISKRCKQGQCSSALPSLRAARAKRVRLHGQPGFPSLRVARGGSLAHAPKLICFGNNCALRSRSLTNALAAPGAAALRALRASQGRALRATVRLRMCQSCFALATPERFEAERGFRAACGKVAFANSVQSAAGTVSPAAEAGALRDLPGKPLTVL